jgi:ABC-type spermidine/putrescine transport system permease subunit I
MDFCEYRGIFGEPGQGIHSYRFLNIAIVDVLLTVLLGYFIAYYTNTPVWIVLILLFIMGILVHRLFCVRTTLDKLLFPVVSR